MKKFLLLFWVMILLAGLIGTANADLLFSASLRNGDYGGGAAINTMGPNHGGSPGILGIVNSPQGTTFTSTESDSQSNALINWQITNATQRNTFRNQGTISFWVNFDSNQFVSGHLFCDNYGFNQFNHGQAGFASAASRMTDGVMLSWSAWSNNVWDSPYDNTNRLQFDRWYNVGYVWGGQSNDFEIWVNGVLVSAQDWSPGVFPWGMASPPSGYNIGLGDNHERGYDQYNSLAGATFADIQIWNEYRPLGNTAVPIPPTVLLLGSGLVGLGAWRRFRKS
jgi:hypothetical protein